MPGGLRGISRSSPSTWVLQVGTLAACLFAATPALAQDPEADEPGDDVTLQEEEAPSDEQDALEGEDSDETVPAEQAPAEPDKTGEKVSKMDTSTRAVLIGLRHRLLVVPKWLINSFGLDGGKTFVTHGFGGEAGGYFGKAGTGFMVLGSVWYAPYHLKDVVWKKKKDDDSQWEVIDSNLNGLYITVDAAWDFRLVQRLSLNVGMGVGIGVVTGKLYLNETYVDLGPNPDYPANGDHPALTRCAGPAAPDGARCPSDGDYGESERWPVYPWLNVQMGLRYQVVDEFAARLDLGVGSSGFWVGIGADYSLWL